KGGSFGGAVDQSRDIHIEAAGSQDEKGAYHGEREIVAEFTGPGTRFAYGPDVVEGVFDMPDHSEDRIHEKGGPGPGNQSALGVLQGPARENDDLGQNLPLLWKLGHEPMLQAILQPEALGDSEEEGGDGHDGKQSVQREGRRADSGTVLIESPHRKQDDFQCLQKYIRREGKISHPDFPDF